MKNKLIVVFAFVVALFATSCEQFGLLGQGGVSGKDAKKEILAADTEAIIIRAAIGRISSTAVALTMLIDGIAVPGIAGISEGKHYTRSSVDDCVGKIKTVSVLLGTWIGPITCNLETVPPIIQIGDTGI